jgi:electron transfer flavoprotein alpha subunit
MILIDNDKCNSCGLCEQSCPFAAIVLTPDGVRIGDACTLCGSCVHVCPQSAITLERKAISTEDLHEYKGVMVVVECTKRNDTLIPKPVACELVSKARELADTLNQNLMAVVMGDDPFAGLEDLGAYGADIILKCAHPLLKQFSPDGYCAVLSSVITDIKPSVVLYGATPNGRELAPRVAARLHLGLTADCTALDIDEHNQLVQTRPAFGGNIMASIISPATRPQTATVRPNVFSAVSHDPSRKAQIRNIPVVLNKASIRTRIIEEVCRDEDQGPTLDETQIIVTIGRGFCKKENIEKARLLANTLGGVLAGTRPVVEDGLIAPTHQVGQSGNTVAPEIYIALGVNGAIQHTVGMNSSKTIIAVNNDPDAPIFKIADLGVVQDASKVVDSLLTALAHG